MGMGMHHPMMGMVMGGYGHRGMGGMGGMGMSDEGVPLKVKSFMRSKKKRKKKRKERAAVKRLIAQGRKDRLKAKMAKMGKRRLLQMEGQEQGQVQKCAVDGEA